MLAIIAANLMAIAYVSVGATFKVASTYSVTVGDFQIFRGAFTLTLMTPALLLTGKHPCKDLVVKGVGD